MKKTVKTAVFILFVGCVLLFTASKSVSDSLPDSFYVVEGQTLTFCDELLVTTNRHKGKDDGKAAAVSTGQAGESYRVDLKLFGIVPLRTADVKVVSATYVVPSGRPFGIKIFTDGVMIVGMTDVDTENGSVNPAKNAGMQIGDIILAIDGKTVLNNDEVAKCIAACQNGTVNVTARRDNTSFTVTLAPARSQTDGKLRAGMWVRDSSAGIGTLTFYNPSTKVFAGLGHAVCDVDTKEVLPLMTGEIVGAEITDVVKGVSGTTGELRGKFVESQKLGTLVLNTESGVYGLYSQCSASDLPLPLAMCQQVRQGKAQVISSVDGTPKAYDCVIENLNYKDKNTDRHMVIRITDKTLLAKTGGIVQGMSGSPILQNGMLVGAVTHVFVNDPTRGYGIFAETMYETAQTVDSGAVKKKVS